MSLLAAIKARREGTSSSIEAPAAPSDCTLLAFGSEAEGWSPVAVKSAPLGSATAISSFSVATLNVWVNLTEMGDRMAAPAEMLGSLIRALCHFTQIRLLPLPQLLRSSIRLCALKGRCRLLVVFSAAAC
jgi:hypothetical protein